MKDRVQLPGRQARPARRSDCLPASAASCSGWCPPASASRHSPFLLPAGLEDQLDFIKRAWGGDSVGRDHAGPPTVPPSSHSKLASSLPQVLWAGSVRLTDRGASRSVSPELGAEVRPIPHTPRRMRSEGSGAPGSGEENSPWRVATPAVTQDFQA